MQWSGPEEEKVCKENWVWDSRSKSPEVVLSRDSNAAYFHTDPVVGSQGAAGKHSVLHCILQYRCNPYSWLLFYLFRNNFVT